MFWLLHRCKFQVLSLSSGSVTQNTARCPPEGIRICFRKILLEFPAARLAGSPPSEARHSTWFHLQGVRGEILVCNKDHEWFVVIKVMVFITWHAKNPLLTPANTGANIFFERWHMKVVHTVLPAVPLQIETRRGAHAYGLLASVSARCWQLHERIWFFTELPNVGIVRGKPDPVLLGELDPASRLWQGIEWNIVSGNICSQLLRDFNVG
jgi:hypothetical protein